MLSDWILIGTATLILCGAVVSFLQGRRAEERAEREERQWGRFREELLRRFRPAPTVPPTSTSTQEGPPSPRPRHNRRSRGGTNQTPPGGDAPSERDEPTPTPTATTPPARTVETLGPPTAPPLVPGVGMIAQDPEGAIESGIKEEEAQIQRPGEIPSSILPHMRPSGL